MDVTIKQLAGKPAPVSKLVFLSSSFNGKPKATADNVAFGLPLNELISASMHERSSARMKLLVDFFQSRLLDVSVDLRRGDAAVTQHFLNLSQIGSTRQ